MNIFYLLYQKEYPENDPRQRRWKVETERQPGQPGAPTLQCGGLSKIKPIGG